MNTTSFSHLETAKYDSILRTSLQQEAEAEGDELVAPIEAASSFPAQLARLRAAEAILRAASARTREQHPEIAAKITPTPAQPTLMRPALAWALQRSLAFLVLLAAVVALIVWSEGRPPPAAAASSHASVQFIQPSTSAFVVHLPLFGSGRPPTKLQPEVLLTHAADTQQARDDEAHRRAHQQLRLEHEREEAARAETSSLSASAVGGFASSASPQQRHLLCDSPTAAESFPDADTFTEHQLYQGAVILHFIALSYIMCGWSVLWMDYMNPLARHIGQIYGLHTNKGEATLLALAGCLPNFIMSLFAVFFTKRDFGTGAVMGSGIMNTFMIPAAIYFFLPHVAFPIFWWRASRDLVCFSVSTLIMVALTITGQQISLGEGIVLLAVAGVYIYVLKRDSTLYAALGKALYSAKKKKLREKRQGKKRSGLQRMLEHPWFSNFITLCIIVSICFVIWDSIHAADFLVSANYAISAIFLLEAVLKIFAYGTLNYWSDPVHAFDGVLCVLIMFELIFGNGAVATSVRAVRLFRFLRALRGLRAVRVYRNSAFAEKVAQKFQSRKAVEGAEGQTAAAAGGFSVVAVPDASSASVVAASSGGGPASDAPPPARLLEPDDAATHQPMVLVDREGDPVIIGEDTLVTDAAGHPFLHADGAPILAVELPIEAGTKHLAEDPQKKAEYLNARRVSLSRRASQSKRRGSLSVSVRPDAGATASSEDAAVASDPAIVPPHINTVLGEDGTIVAGSSPSTAAAFVSPELFVAMQQSAGVHSHRGAGSHRGTAPSSMPGFLRVDPAVGRRKTGAAAVAEAASLVLPPSPSSSKRTSPRLASHRAANDPKQFHLSPDSQAALAIAGSGPLGAASMRVLVRPKHDEDSSQQSVELIVIAGNAGVTAEEMALLALDDDDEDDDDDDDDIEEEEDEEDHWTEMLAEDDGRGPKGQVGEPILDAHGKPTGLIKVFVRGVEPRRWSAAGPKWNPYRVKFGILIACMMTGMAVLIIAVNIKNQIAGTA